MNSKWLALMTFVAFSAPSLALTHVVCGQQIDPVTQEVYKFELAIESHNDEFVGPVGANWNLRLADDGSGWMAANSNFMASTYQDGDSTVVEIELQMSKAITGPVGLTYLLIDPLSENPILEKYALGGYMHNVKLGNFACLRVRGTKPN